MPQQEKIYRTLEFYKKGGGARIASFNCAESETILYCRPETDDTGSLYFGDGTKDMDVRFTLGAAADYVQFDVGLGRLVIAGAATVTLASTLGIAGVLTVSLTTDASSLTVGALVVAGGIACAKKLFIGDDIDMSVSGTGVYDLVLKTNVADALSIKDSAADIIVFTTTSGTPVVTITPITTITGIVTINGAITMGDAKDIITNGGTGTKIGTATSQKLGFWNTAPVVQGVHIADPTGGGTTDAEARTAIASINAMLALTGLTAAS